MNDLKALAERLKTQAPHCSVTWEEDGLRVQSACGEVRAAGDRVLFLGDVYRNLRMADSSSLCTAVALFAQCLEEGGPVEPHTREERCACNPTYRATAAALKKLDRQVLTVLAAAEAVLLAALVLSGQSILAMAMILALVGTVPWRANRTIHILAEHWVCPHCHAALPRMPHTTTALRYACCCPACGQKLETDPLSRYAHEPDVDQAARAPGNRACLVSGMVILLCALAGLALFGAALTGLGLLFLPVRPPREVTFSAGVRRRDSALVPAFFCWPLGLALLGMGVWSARQGLSAGYWAAAGLLLTALGALALLDRRNRALFFLSGGTLLRFDLWGRRQERTVQQIVSVRSCPGRSLALLGEDGRVFFTARSGMCQFQRVRNWAEARQIPIQLVAPPVAGRSVQCWRNAFRSRMHLHLNAARVSLALALAALWAGCLLPPALFALGGLQLGDAVLWMGAAPPAADGLPGCVCAGDRPGRVAGGHPRLEGHARAAALPAAGSARGFAVGDGARCHGPLFVCGGQPRLPVAVGRLYAGTCGAGMSADAPAPAGGTDGDPDGAADADRLFHGLRRRPGAAEPGAHRRAGANAGRCPSDRSAEGRRPVSCDGQTRFGACIF